MAPRHVPGCTGTPMTFGCEACIAARNAAHDATVHKTVNDGLSATRRLTLRNNRYLEAGRHPATGMPTVIHGPQCADCVNLRTYRIGTSRHVHKCVKHRLGVSRSAHSDIRLSWPACTLYEAAPEES